MIIHCNTIQLYAPRAFLAVTCSSPSTTYRAHAYQLKPVTVEKHLQLLKPYRNRSVVLQISSTINYLNSATISHIRAKLLYWIVSWKGEHSPQDSISCPVLLHVWAEASPGLEAGEQGRHTPLPAAALRYPRRPSGTETYTAGSSRMRSL